MRWRELYRLKRSLESTTARLRDGSGEELWEREEAGRLSGLWLEKLGRRGPRVLGRK